MAICQIVDFIGSSLLLGFVPYFQVMLGVLHWIARLKCNDTVPAIFIEHFPDLKRSVAHCVVIVMDWQLIPFQATPYVMVLDQIVIRLSGPRDRDDSTTTMDIYGFHGFLFIVHRFPWIS